MTLNQEVPSLNPATNQLKRSAGAVGQGTLPKKIVLDNDHIPSLDYEYGMLKDLIAALESDAQN